MSLEFKLKKSCFIFKEMSREFWKQDYKACKEFSFNKKPYIS